MAASKPKIQHKPFTMVRRSLWTSDRFARLPGDATRYLYFYFLTGPHQTASGCFVARDAYVLADLDMPGGDWTAGILADRKQCLVESGLILADNETGETLVTRWWKDNGPSNPAWFQGARTQCEGIRSDLLREAATVSLDECWQAYQGQRGLVVRPVVSLTDRLASLQNRGGGAP